jgi:hypothetical protein
MGGRPGLQHPIDDEHHDQHHVDHRQFRLRRIDDDQHDVDHRQFRLRGFDDDQQSHGLDVDDVDHQPRLTPLGFEYLVGAY